MSSACFFLVRHAHADWRPDEMRPLSGRGHRDARRVAGLLTPMRPDVLYSSPSLRARQTIAPLAMRLGLEIREEDDLRERTLGNGWQPDWPAAIRPTWDDFSFAYPGGETNAAAQQRARAVYRRLSSRHPGGRVVLATHGNLLVLLLNHLDPSIGFDFWCGLSFPDIYRLEIGAEGRPEVRRLWRADLEPPETQP